MYPQSHDQQIQQPGEHNIFCRKYSMKHVLTKWTFNQNFNSSVNKTSFDEVLYIRRVCLLDDKF